MHLKLSQSASARLPDGTELTLTDLDAALLAWLALEGPTARNRLAALLWPGSSAEAAGNSLRQRLFRLKRQCGMAPVVGAGVLALAEGVHHDLQEAGDVLGGVQLEFGPEFADWLRRQRSRRTDRLRQSLTELADMAEQARDFGDAMQHAQELLALEPLSEAAHRRVIRLHYLAGDRAAALLAFDRCERLLKDEIGAAPDAQTLALLRALERETADSSLQPAAAVPAVVLRPPRLVGRAAELRVLESAVADGRVVLLSGEAGLGKSRLIAALCESSSATTAVLSVAARVGDDMAPFALAARWLRALLQRPGMEPSDAQRADLAGVLPELGPAAPRSPAADRARQAQAIEALLVTAAGQGLRACALDDLQYADAASVELLHALAGCDSVGWVLALRPDGLGEAQRALLSAHRDSTRATALALQPLAGEDVEALLDSLGLPGVGGSEQAQALKRRTGGNPMYLLETIKAAWSTHGGALVPMAGRPEAAVVWPQADNVLRLIQQRLSRLSPLATQVVRCAAIAGQDLSAALVAQVLGLRPLDLADAWAELESAQVLRDGGGFAHDLIAEAARSSLARAIARPLHGEVAAYLEQHGGEPARVAEHWLEAGEPLRAVPHLGAAAQRARGAGRLLEAAELYERAAHALQDAGQRGAAFDAYFAAQDLLSESTFVQRLEGLIDALDALADNDDGRRALAACARIVLLGELGRHDDAVQLAMQALPWAERAALPDVQAELHWDLAALRWMRRELAEATRHAEQALACLERADPAHAHLARAGRSLTASRSRVLNALGLLMAAAGRLADANARLEENWHLARAERDVATARNIAAGLAMNSLDQGQLAPALHWSEQAMADDERLDVDPSTRLTAWTNRTAVLAISGDLGGAVALADRVAALCAQGTARAIPAALRRMHWLECELGRRDLARKGLQALLERPGLLAIDRLAIEATLLHAGGPPHSADLLDRIAGLDDFPMRARLLVLARPGCDAKAILPLLSATAATARDCGAMGLWLDLQLARLAALRDAGRSAEAAQSALALWARLDQGLVGMGLFDRQASAVVMALLDSHASLAGTVRLRISAWRDQAASTLPEPWRENYLARSPSMLGDSPSARGPRLAP